jgi:hypothetical protein
VNNTDHSVAGFQHDEAVLAAALAMAELDRNDTMGVREARYQMAYAASSLDAAQAASPHRSTTATRGSPRGCADGST